jgi:hypothetical protein
METRQREKDWLAVAKYMVRRRDRPSPTWRSFLLNQAQGIAAITCLSWLAHRFGCCMSADRKSIARFTLEGFNFGLIPANSAGAIFDLRTDPENVSFHAWISNDSQKSERSTMD